MTGIPQFDELQAFLANVAQADEKTATDKAASTLSEGDNGKRPVHTGALFSENASDMKTIPTAGVADQKPLSEEGGTSKAVPLGEGLEQGASGELLSVARAVEMVSRGSKEASDLSSPEGLAAATAAAVKLAADLRKLVNEAAVANKTESTDANKSASATQTATTNSEQTTNTDIATALGFTDKAAADKAAADVIAAYSKVASDHAYLTANYLDGFQKTYAVLIKAAEDGELEKQVEKDDSDKSEPAESDPAAAPAPVDPAAAAPADGGGGSDESLQALAEVLAAHGITPQELEQVLAGAMGGGGAAPPPDMGGGMPVMAGGSPPPEAAAAAMPKMAGEKAILLGGGIKVARALNKYVELGRYKPNGFPKTAEQKAQRQQANVYIKELLAAAGR